MVLNGIDVFVEVVDAQSFSRAAQRLGMPPATVSSKIASLERQLGITLIRRTTRKLHITDAGKRYYEGCVQALAALRDAESAMASVREEPSGTLRLTVPADLAQTVMPPLIEGYAKAYPGVTLEMIVTNQRLDLVAEGIDLAVRVGTLKDSSLVVRKFRTGRGGLWAAQSYLDLMGTPLVPADLEQHRFVRFSRMPASTILRSATDSFAIGERGQLVSDEMENVRTLVLRGNGIALLPEFVGLPSDLEAPLVRVLPDYATDSEAVHFVYPSQQFVPLTVRTFIAMATGDRS